MSDVMEKSERRMGPDRRQKPADLCSSYVLRGGKRRCSRRKADRRRHLLADSYSSLLWLKLLSLFGLSILDAYLTILLIQSGLAKEANPVMAFYLGYGPQTFIAMNLLFTTAPLFLFCICKDYSLTGITLKSSLVIYLCLIAYELSILFHHSSLAAF